jgi:hypothetical protein
MQAAWREKRRKDLCVPESLVGYIGDESHRRNERTQGREGGRIVRKLMADLIEAPIQRAATARPEAYRECGQVVLEARFPESEKADPPPAPEISVSFERAEPVERGSEETEDVG